MWIKIKTLKGIPFTQIKILMVEQTIYTDPEEIADQIGQYFYSNSSNSSLNSNFLKCKENQELTSPLNATTTTNQGTILNEPITILELNSSLQGKKSNSCGPDKIPFIFLQNLSANGKHLFLKLYNNVWLSGIIPKICKNANITPIPKKEQDKHKPSGYHPIFVLCKLSKTLEKIIYNRLS